MKNRYSNLAHTLPEIQYAVLLLYRRIMSLSLLALHKETVIKILLICVLLNSLVCLYKLCSMFFEAMVQMENSYFRKRTYNIFPHVFSELSNCYLLGPT